MQDNRHTEQRNERGAVVITGPSSGRAHQIAMGCVLMLGGVLV